MRDLLPAQRPALVLAPMQAITDLPFMRVLARRSLPDWFVCEYFRVHPASTLNPHLLRTITENQTARPVFAQMIGSDLASLQRTALALAAYPIAGIDLNLGCPAPIVCRKAAGGGLLRDPEAINRLLGGLREAIGGRFTVKTRLGYLGSGEFEGLLEIFRRHAIDGLTIHARTVHQGYQGPVDTTCVHAAVATLSCPVIANGNIVDVPSALAYHGQSAAAGLMIGRGAIRNPWIFGQVRTAFEGGSAILPTYRDLLGYIRELSEEIAREAPYYEPLGHVQRMKRTLGYISHGLDPAFEYAVRRCCQPAEFWTICEAHLTSDELLPARPPLASKLYSGFAQLTGEE
ncbi:MAG: tRNA-dihydrouridine synthase family protein [Verrucomicrobia bacterium]|nr:MAG: tRNA-dihydrouridine synthase family protein [Verrucomicrobiota bacterium]